jgi:hypothetical protein
MIAKANFALIMLTLAEYFCHATGLSILFIFSAFSIAHSLTISFCITLYPFGVRGGFFSANRQYIEKLPIHTIDDGDPKERRLHDDLVKLVEVMVGLRKREQKAEGHELEQLKRQIEKTDHEIDERVYELYGIVEKEKELVEKSCHL